jgi:hypothetical protein
MKRFKNHLIVATVLSLLAIAGTIMNSHQAKAQGPPGGLAVNIVNPLPVPVTGSTTVSGTVAATQSGAWNVGITGTPNVNVTNPATAPVLALDISKSASRHVQLDCEIFSGAGSVCTDVAALTPYVVPPGQNLVVTSVDIVGAAGGGVFTVAIQASQFVEGSWSVAKDALTHSFQYPSGIVYPAGFTFGGTNVFMSSPSDTLLQGYLSPI